MRKIFFPPSLSVDIASSKHNTIVDWTEFLQKIVVYE